MPLCALCKAVTGCGGPDRMVERNPKAALVLAPDERLPYIADHRCRLERERLGEKIHLLEGISTAPVYSDVAKAVVD